MVREPRSFDNPEETLRSHDLADALCRALAQLGSRSAEVFVLRDIEGLSNEEIASLLGTSANSVTVTCHRARTRLMEITLILGRYVCKGPGDFKKRKMPYLSFREKTNEKRNKEFTR